MFLYEQLLNGEITLSVIGLGYVGISTAFAFSQKFHVVGFDLDGKKIELYKNGIDPTGQIGNEEIKNAR